MTGFSTGKLLKGGGICVAVAAPDTGSVIAGVQPILDQVDIVEIRLDAMKDINIAELCGKINLPLLFTNRAHWEGGSFKGSEAERIQLLEKAIQHGADYIDLELKTHEQYRQLLLNTLTGTPTKMIISYHNFAMTPESGELSEIFHNQLESGAQIGKIVTMAHDHLDVLRVLGLQEQAWRHDFPLIAFCMGEPGKLSRIATLLLGGFMTYAAIDESQATAPGQLTVTELTKALISLN